MQQPGPIRPLAAAHLRDALTAVEQDRIPEAVGALMSIDEQSWAGIEERLAGLGSSVTALVAQLTPGERK